MNLRSSLAASAFVRALLILWIVSTALTTYLLLSIDNVVNVQLYRYGLQFSLDWAVPYWTFIRCVFAFLAVPLVISGAVLVMSVPWKVGERKVEVGVVHRQVVEQRVKSAAVPERQRPTESRDVVTCPRCKRVFRKPLTTLRARVYYNHGEYKVMNVCPYCNQILGEAKEEKGEKDDVGVIGLEKKKQIER